MGHSVRLRVAVCPVVELHLCFHSWVRSVDVPTVISRAANTQTRFQYIGRKS